MTNLVLLDFWAEWCGPCKQLSPVLEKIAADYADKSVKLVKIDVDTDKVIAAQFRVQSIPTVYAFYQGQPLADLTNYRTEGQITRILDQLLQQLDVPAAGEAESTDTAPLVAMGEEVLAAGDSQRAITIFRQVHELAPDDPAVVGGLLRSLIASGELAEARTIIDALTPVLAKDAAVARARAALELAEAAPAGETAELEHRVASNPDDLDARFELAGAAMASDRERAADELFDIIGRDKDWNEGAARKRLLQLLEAQGIEDPWARAQRRRLSALLFT
ncbi:MAG: tetratricopeptide repeat protein [Sphingomonas sp.]|nr:tetratricopeptide repeat protein [Sphingomonas sp.]